MITIKDFIELVQNCGIIEDCVFYHNTYNKVVPVDRDLALESGEVVVDLDLGCVAESPYIEVTYE